MIIDKNTGQIQIEPRDVDYILPQYVRSYMFFTKGADPVEIVFPMYSSIPHPSKPGVRVPIRWVPEIDPRAVEIVQDGGNVPEATEEQMAEADSKDNEVTTLKARIAELEAAQQQDKEEEEDVGQQTESAPTTPVQEYPLGTRGVLHDGTPVVYAKMGAVDAPLTERTPRLPANPATGAPDDMHPRQRGDSKQVAADLRPDPDIDEGRQKPYEKTVKRSSKGEPVVEE